MLAHLTASTAADTSPGANASVYARQAEHWAEQQLAELDAKRLELASLQQEVADKQRQVLRDRAYLLAAEARVGWEQGTVPHCITFRP